MRTPGGTFMMWWVGAGCVLVGMMVGAATFFLDLVGLVAVGVVLLLCGAIGLAFLPGRAGVEWTLFAASFAMLPVTDLRLPIGGLSVPVAAFFAVLAMGITCVRLVAARDWRLEDPGILFSLALILIGCTLSVISAKHPDLSVPMLLKWFFHSLLFVMLMSLRNRVSHLWTALTLVLVTGALSIYGLSEHVASGDYDLNFYAGVGSRSATGQHLALVLPLALGVGMLRQLSWPVRLLVWAATGVSLVALTFSYSRGGWLATVTALVIMALSRRRIEIRGVMILSIVAIGLLYLGYLAPQGLQDRFWSIFSVQESQDLSVTNAGRLQRQAEAVKVILAHPILGVGLGNYPFSIAWYKFVSGPVRDPPRGANPHDFYLSIWAEGGAFAFAGFIGMLYFVTKRVLRGLRESTGPIGPNVLRTMLGSLVALCTFLFFSDDFNNILVWTILGLAVSGAHAWAGQGSEAAAERGSPSAERSSVCRREPSRRIHSPGERVGSTP